MPCVLGADHQVHKGPGKLGEREENFGVGIGREASVADIGQHSDHFGGIHLTAHQNVLADGVLIRPIGARQNFVDDDDSRNPWPRRGR